MLYEVITIITAVKETEGLQLAGAIERAGHEQIGSDAGLIAGCGALGVSISGSLEEALKNADVLIDFTFPEVTLQNLAVCAKLGKSIVIGSTGFTPAQKAEVQQAAAKIV